MPAPGGDPKVSTDMGHRRLHLNHSNASHQGPAHNVDTLLGWQPCSALLQQVGFSRFLLHRKLSQTFWVWQPKAVAVLCKSWKSNVVLCESRRPIWPLTPNTVLETMEPRVLSLSFSRTQGHLNYTSCYNLTFSDLWWYWWLTVTYGNRHKQTSFFPRLQLSCYLVHFICKNATLGILGLMLLPSLLWPSFPPSWILTVTPQFQQKVVTQEISLSLYHHQINK